MTIVEQLAQFVVQADYEMLSQEARRELKARVLDSLACAIGALEGEPIVYIRQHTEEFGGAPLCTMIGGGKTSPDRAAFYNGALVRYLDYNDSFLAPGETCHPSDNLGAVMAASEYADRSGRDLLTALAVAYQVQCRLSEVAPVRHKGFDHTTQGTYAAGAGVAKALGLDAERTAHAIALAATPNNAYPHTGFVATHAAFLARRGITGPLEVFEGNKGFMDAIAGHFQIDWSREDLELVRKTIIKKYNAEIHSQSAIEGLLELQALHGFRAEDVERIDLETFQVAFMIIGGGEEGDKHIVQTKEEADHSLPYMLAVALLDGDVGPPQYEPERIVRDDVQSLLRRVHVRPVDEFSARFPQEMPARLRVTLKDGRVLQIEKRDYEGFHTRPMPWERVLAKFERLAGPYTDASLRREIAACVQNLENVPVRELTALLARAGK